MYLLCVALPLMVLSISPALGSLISSIYARASGSHFSFRYCEGRKCHVNHSERGEMVALSRYTDGIHSVGWGVLQISSSAKFEDHIQAYWSGFLETNSTYSLTDASWHNTLSELCPRPLSLECQQLREYLFSNLDYVIRKAYRSHTTEAYWHQILMQMWQIKGITDAFNKVFIKTSDQLTGDYLLSLREEVVGIYLLQLSSELSEICTALSLQSLSRRLGACHTLMVDGPSCSALIKLVPGDVYISHVTWTSYCSMLRVLKYYHFPWKRTHKGAKTIPGHTISFPSYPSVISSADDFYITSTKLVVMETTNQNFNHTLWSLVRDGARSSVLEGFRVMAANRLAERGDQWVRYFSMENSGTYNNQWMVFNSKLYHPSKALPTKGVLYVAEQIPGRVESEDVTHILREQTYWASYNLPYFPSIYNESGFQAFKERYGDFFDYHKTARAQMFQRDHSKVVNLTSMYRLMRYNNFKHDPLSRCKCDPPYTADKAISSRSDLNDPKGVYPIHSYGYRLHGATDVKITNFEMLQTFDMLAESGPTYDDVPAFDWSKINIRKPRMHPTRWTFKPIKTEFGRPPCRSSCRAPVYSYAL